MFASAARRGASLDARARILRLQKMQNPTGAACAAAPRLLQTLARAGSRRAASGRFLTTVGQHFPS